MAAQLSRRVADEQLDKAALHAEYLSQQQELRDTQVWPLASVLDAV